MRLRFASLVFTLLILMGSAAIVFAQATPEADAPELGYEFPAGSFPGMYGEVALPENPTRIVTITDGALDLVIALGLQPVGYTISSNGTGPADYLADKVDPSVETVGGWGEVDGGIDVEAVALLNPDLVLADRYVDYPEGTYDLLVAAGITVIVTGEIEVAGADSLQQWEYEALGWAHALGKYDEALELIKAARERGAGIKASLGDAAGQSVVVFRPQSDFPVIMSHLWITGVVLTWCGFVGNELTADMPPPHSGRGVSLEQLDMLDADWLLAAARDESMQAALQQYLDMPIFNQLAAVQNNHVVLVDGALWSGATGILASHAMMDEIEAIFVTKTATPVATS